MTLVPECQLAREAQICYVSMSTVTDYDVWAEKPVTAKEVMETMAISKLAVKQIEDVAKRANRITRWARNNGQMGAEANSIKKLAKELNDVMDKWTKGDTVIVR